MLLQVKHLDDGLQQNTISVLSSVATSFQLKAFSEVHVKQVLPKVRVIFSVQ